MEASRGAGYVYVAYSPRVNEIARDIGKEYVFKAGYSDCRYDRIETLRNGFPDPAGTTRPCLHATDWEAIACWSFSAKSAALEAEDRVKDFLKEEFGCVDRRLFVREEASANGETEIYRFDPSRLHNLADLIYKANANDPLSPEVVRAAMEHVSHIIYHEFVLTISDQDERDRPYDNDPYEDGSFDDEDDFDLENDEEDIDDDHDDIIREHDSDGDGFARNKNDGWPYGDD